MRGHGVFTRAKLEPNEGVLESNKGPLKSNKGPEV